MTEWMKFFVLRLPLALLLFELAVEGSAQLLKGVTLHRHNVDDLAYAVEHDPHPYRVVLIGDSVTHMVAHRFRIGEPGEVAEMTTHAAAGLPSSLFLLKRYLESGHRPQHVVLAASVHVYLDPLYKPDFNYYVQSVFTRPYERQFLERYYPDYVDYRWKPAALSMSTTLGEPLFSLLRHPGNAIWAPTEAPPPHPRLEQFPGDSFDPGIFHDRVTEPMVIRPDSRAALAAIYGLSVRYGFALHIIWAPVQTQLRDALEARGATRQLNEQMAAIFQGPARVSFDSSDDRQAYPYFDRGMVHIKGLGWEETYANELTAFIHEFEARTPAGYGAKTAGVMPLPAGSK